MGAVTIPAVTLGRERTKCANTGPVDGGHEHHQPVFQAEFNAPPVSTSRELLITRAF